MRPENARENFARAAPIKSGPRVAHVGMVWTQVLYVATTACRHARGETTLALRTLLQISCAMGKARVAEGL
eukprot:5956448-Lingulodinium_polyedra.AAC.1